MSDSFNKNFEGALDNKIKIQMNLVRKGGDLSGSYFYEKYRKKIILKGAIDENGYFEITEYDEKNQENGAFYGAFISDEAMVGFWNSAASPDRRLSFQLVESGKLASSLISNENRPTKLGCQVKNNNGSLSILMIGSAIVGFEYDNVGGNYHTCGLLVDRRQKGVRWEDGASLTKIIFTKEFFENDQSAEVSIKKSASGYDINFSGDLSYFCGVRAALPSKVSVYKSGNVWVGKAQYQ
ncbi:MAG: hypothetical protein AB1631_10575 [Acidobacteriota bacterium]